MKRAALERQRTIIVWRRHLATHQGNGMGCVCDGQPGRFRKGQRVGGCGNSRCYLCHYDKLCDIPTPSQRRADLSYLEWCRELSGSAIAKAKPAINARSQSSIVFSYHRSPRVISTKHQID